MSPDSLRVTETPSAYRRMIRLYDDVGAAYDTIYRTQHNVRTVVDEIARECAQLSINVYEKVPRTDYLPSARLAIPDHPMAKLLDEPMPSELEDEFGFWFKLFGDILVYDIAHWQVINRRGLPAALLRLPPQSITPDRDVTTNWVRGWRTVTGQIIPTSQVITFWGFDPAVNHGSISPMETIRRLIAEEVARDKNRQGMWRRSLRKDGIIEIDPEGRQLTDEGRESWLLDAEDALSGSDQAGRPLMLEPGWHWKDSVFSPRDMEYLKARQVSRQEVAAAFHCPPAKVAAAENGAQVDEMTHDEFYQSTLPPYLSRVESVIQAQLLPRFDLNPEVRRNRYVKFNLDEKLRGAFEDRAKIMATTAGGPIVTVNEARTRLDLPPKEGFDELYSPMNSTRGGGPQASPNSPVDTPADINPAGTTPGGGTRPPLVAVSSETPGSVDDVVRRYQEQRDYQLSVAKYQAKHERVLQRHFLRQKASSKKLDAERWDRELKDDLLGVAIEASVEFGPFAADHEKVARLAQEINEETKMLSDAGEQAFDDARAERLALELAKEVVSK